MKRSLVLLASLAIAACGSDTPTGPGGGGGSSSMAATVANESWAPLSTQIEASYFNNNLLAFSGRVSGGSNPDRQVNITVNGVTGTGTFDLGPANPGAFALVTVSGGGSAASIWTTALSPSTGSIIITSIDSEGAQGTFTFSAQFQPGTAATGQISVTSGTFDLKF